ncbi:MAG: hypothetical protein DRJ14_03335 [Acidobacteria bacterium]|nr:MAG: hypothetical protein DRJ14_03335 [Acidobacteriota bacterium]
MQSELKGKINLMAIADVLQWIHHGHKTGALHLTGERFKKQIFFKDGQIVATSSTNPREYLGQFLISYGKITEEGLKELLETQEKNEQMLGKLLVDESILSLSEIRMFLEIKAQESLFDIFLWESGEFEFRDGESLSKEFIDINLDVTSIILEGVRRVDEWARIRRKIPNGQYIPVTNAIRVINALPLSSNLTKLLRALDGKKSIDDITMEFRSSKFIVFKNLFECYENGLIRMKQPKQALQHALAEEVVPKIKALMASGFIEPYLMAESFLVKYPSSTPIRQQLSQLINKAEQTIRKGEAIPQLACSLNDLANQNLSPEEGFLVSRINGKWDINSIIKISPIPEERAKIIFAELIARGIITVDE